MADQALNLLNKSLVKFATSSLINYQTIRTRLWANVRPIMGWPRPHLALRGKKYPVPHRYNWLPYLPQDGHYTARPLPIHKLGGRDMETGRVVVRTLGGGNPKKFRWVDTVRKANDDGSVKEERVLIIRYDPLHTPKIALVADSERTRWIMATHGIQVGDIVRTYSELPRNPVRAKIGDAHPIGALPVGSYVHMIEKTPGMGAKFCVVAGSSADIVKRSLDHVVIKLPNGDSCKLDSTCMAVVGQLSNVGHEHVQILCPQRSRWLGRRPRSGQWHRKDGYCGRKVHHPKMLDLTMRALVEKMDKKDADIFDLSV